MDILQCFICTCFIMGNFKVKDIACNPKYCASKFSCWLSQFYYIASKFNDKGNKKCSNMTQLQRNYKLATTN